ncbi:zinc finger BED domain-containing 1-like, partial [Paramuricea clavata]
VATKAVQSTKQAEETSTFSDDDSNSDFKASESAKKAQKSIGYAEDEDMWSSHGLTPYMGLVLHWVDSEWNLRNRHLGIIITLPIKVVAAFVTSWKRRRNLEAAQVQEEPGKKVKKLASECPTRWGSTLHMISCVLANKKAIRRVLGNDKDTSHLVPSWQDLEVLECIDNTLSPLKAFTDILLSTVELASQDSDPPLACQLKREILRRLKSRYVAEDLKVLMDVTSFIDPRYITDFLTTADEAEQSELNVVQERLLEQAVFLQHKEAMIIQLQNQIEHYIKYLVIDGNENPFKWWQRNKELPLLSQLAKRFLKLVTLLHFVDNNAITDEEKKGRLWKLRPWLDATRQNFLQIPPKECQSIDEIIIPFKGRSCLKVYMPKKPHGKNFKDFADNYFSSVALAEKLKKRQIYYIGTVKMNCVTGNKLPKPKEMKKTARGHCVAQVERNTNVVCVQWKDNKVVSLISSYVGREPMTGKARYHQEQSTDGGEVLPLRKFRAACVYALTSAGKGKKRTCGHPSLEEQEILEANRSQKKRYVGVPEDVQKDEFDHFPMYDPTRQRCKVCSRKNSAFSHIM